MDFLTVLQVARRWWKTVLALLIATTFLALAVAASVPVNYEARGVVLLEPPVPVETDAEGRPVAQNRLLNISGSLNVVGDIIARVLNDDSTVEALRFAGAADYEVTSQPQGAPLLQVETTSTSQEESLATVELVGQAIADELARQQDASGVSDSALIVARPLTSPSDTTSLYGGKMRAVVAVSILGVAATLSIALLLDSLAQRRRAAPGQTAPTARRRTGTTDTHRAARGNGSTAPAPSPLATPGSAPRPDR